MVLEKLFDLNFLSTGKLNTQVEILNVRNPKSIFEIVAASLNWVDQFLNYLKNSKNKNEEEFSLSKLEEKLLKTITSILVYNNVRYFKNFTLSSALATDEQSRILQLLLNLIELGLLEEDVFLERKDYVFKKDQQNAKIIYKYIVEKIKLNEHLIPLKSISKLLNELKKHLPEKYLDQLLVDGIITNLIIALIIHKTIKETLGVLSKKYKVVVEPKLERKLEYLEKKKLSELIKIEDLKIFQLVPTSSSLKLEICADIAILEETKLGKKQKLRLKCLIEIKRIRSLNKLKKLLNSSDTELQESFESVVKNLIRILISGIVVKYLVIVYVCEKIKDIEKRVLENKLYSQILRKVGKYLIEANADNINILLNLVSKMLTVKVIEVDSKETLNEHIKNVVKIII